MINVFDENLFTLNEAYFKKSKNILNAEKCIRKIKEELAKDPDKNLNDSKIMNELSKTFADEFGFEKVLLTIYGDKAVPNGFTYKFTYSTKVGTSTKDLAMVRSKGGMKYKDPKNKVMAIYIAVSIFLEASVDEIMAVYLHEIGHNFFISAYNFKFFKLDQLIQLYAKYVGAFRKAVANNSLSVLEIMRHMKLLSKFNADLKKLKKDFVASDGTYIPDPKNFEELIEFYHKVYTIEYQNMLEESKKTAEYIEELKEKRKQNPSLLKKFATIFSSIIFSPFILFDYLLTPIIFMSNLGDEQFLESRLDEKFADNFAISYGYGAASASLFKRFENFGNSISRLPSEEVRKKSPIYGLITKFFAYKRMRDMIVGDVHPSERSRMNFVKNKLEHELKNTDLTPEQKKDIENQLIEVMKILDDKDEIVKMYENIEKKFKYSKKYDDKMEYSDEEIFDFDVTMQQEYITTAESVKFALPEEFAYPLNTKSEILYATEVYDIIDEDKQEEFTKNLLEAIDAKDIDLQCNNKNYNFYNVYLEHIEQDEELNSLIDNLF